VHVQTKSRIDNRLAQRRAVEKKNCRRVFRTRVSERVIAVRDTGVGGRVRRSDSHHRSLLRHHHRGHLAQGGAAAP